MTPRSIAAARLSLEDTVGVREEGGSMVIEPVQPKPYDLSRLVADIPPENRHEEVDFGKPVRKERL